MTQAEIDKANARRYLAIRNGTVYIERDDDAGTIYVVGEAQALYCKTGEELDAYIDREIAE